jgi:hypothetical protein
MKTGRCLLIHIAVSGGGNMVKKEAEKVLKCKDLTVEIQHVCNVKNESGTRTQATGSFSKSFRKNIPGKQDIKHLQRTALLGTAHICPEVFVKVQGDSFGTRPKKTRISQRLFIIQFNIL